MITDDLDNDPKIVYVLFNADENVVGVDQVYAIASTYELAEKIAKKDEEDGLILSGWFIEKWHLNTSEEEV